MKNKRFKITTNRNEFNKLYKIHLEHNGKIGCTYCKYHKNENFTNKCYFGFDSIENIIHPNWKLVSKNKKQWMKKNMRIKIEISRHSGRIHYEIII